MSGRTKVAVLFSGRGSNLDALARAATRSDYPAEIVIAISDKDAAGGFDVAARHGISAQRVARESFAGRDAFEDALQAALVQSGAELICLAGFMRILSAGFVARWPGKILNIHPSLLPSFKGLDTHRQALEAGVRLHGATVHVVTAALDDGPILAQAAVPVIEGDNEAVLAERVLGAEHALYPAALAAFVSGNSGPAPRPDGWPLFSPPVS